MSIADVERLADWSAGANAAVNGNVEGNTEGVDHGNMNEENADCEHDWNPNHIGLHRRRCPNAALDDQGDCPPGEERVEACNHEPRSSDRPNEGWLFLALLWREDPGETADIGSRKRNCRNYCHICAFQNVLEGHLGCDDIEDLECDETDDQNDIDRDSCENCEIA